MPLTPYQQEYAHQGTCELDGVAIRPLEDQVLVKLDTENPKNRGGVLWLPQGHSRLPVRYGTVVALGPGDRVKSKIIREQTGTDDHEREIAEFSGDRWPMEVAVGDRVVMERRPWGQIDYEGAKHTVCFVEQHIAAVENADGTYRPLRDRILVKREDSPSKSGTIHIPDQFKDKSMIGRVVAVGIGHYGLNGKLVPLEVEVGDRVLFSKYAGEDIEIGDDNLLIVREREVMAVLEAKA